ncbi:MAG: DUF4912 domain-containing protein [Candidatus Omnitrophota bacterium]|jgi:hypothetical protein
MAALFRRKKKDSEDDKKAKAKKLEPVKEPVKSIQDLKASARPSKLVPSPVVDEKIKQAVVRKKVAASENEKQVSAKLVKAPPPAPQPVYRETPRELPDSYGDNHIYLMVRDPHWLYSYWEIQKDYHEAKLRELGGNWNEVNAVLRVYDVSDENHKTFYDVYLHGIVKNWYLNVEPNHSYYVEIGLLHRDGRFIALACSNRITTPRAGMSEVIDEHWMGIDFDKMYALSGGFQVGKSSAELQKMMEERLMGAISSGSGAGLLSSMASPVKIPGKKRGFWFILDCELIVYGATEPDARVTLQGREIKLRPDGTFSLRFALPDGHYVLDAHAYSADGIEERIITPVVDRRTERPAPILKPTD